MGDRGRRGDRQPPRSTSPPPASSEGEEDVGGSAGPRRTGSAGGGGGVPVETDERAQRRRATNREASRRLRERRINMIRSLGEELQELRQENEAVRQENLALALELRRSEEECTTLRSLLGAPPRQPGPTLPQLMPFTAGRSAAGGSYASLPRGGAGAGQGLLQPFLGLSGRQGSRAGGTGPSMPTLDRGRSISDLGPSSEGPPGAGRPGFEVIPRRKRSRRSLPLGSEEAAPGGPQQAAPDDSQQGYYGQQQQSGSGRQGQLRATSSGSQYQDDDDEGDDAGGGPDDVRSMERDTGRLPLALTHFKPTGQGWDPTGALTGPGPTTSQRGSRRKPSPSPSPAGGAGQQQQWQPRHGAGPSSGAAAQASGLTYRPPPLLQPDLTDATAAGSAMDITPGEDSSLETPGVIELLRLAGQQQQASLPQQQQQQQAPPQSWLLASGWQPTAQPAAAAAAPTLGQELQLVPWLVQQLQQQQLQQQQQPPAAGLQAPGAAGQQQQQQQQQQLQQQPADVLNAILRLLDKPKE